MKNLKFTIIAIVFIVAIIAISLYFDKGKKDNVKVEKKDFKSIQINAGEQVYTHNSYIYIYGKAGIKIIKDDKIILEDSFSLESPYISTSYDKIAIGDKNGKIVRVYSNEGHMYTVNEVTNVLGFSINKNGFLSIILKNDANYEVKVYNNTGENAYFVKDISYNEGVPVSASISADDNVLAVSYIKTIGATVDSNIVFYSIRDGQMFGGYIKQDQIAGIIKFLGNSNLICISEKEIFIIKSNGQQNSEQVKEIYKRPLNNVLKGLQFLDGVGYVVCYGQPILSSQDFIQENTVVFYNESGGEIGKYYKKDENISHIKGNKFGAILQDGRLFTAIDTSGRKIWQYQATQYIKDVMFYDNDSKAIIVTNNEIKIVKIDKILLDKQIDPNNTETTTQETSEKQTEITSDKKQQSDTTNKQDNNDKNKNDKEETTKDNKKQDKNKQQETTNKNTTTTTTITTEEKQTKQQ